MWWNFGSNVPGHRYQQNHQPFIYSMKINGILPLTFSDIVYSMVSQRCMRMTIKPITQEVWLALTSLMLIYNVIIHYSHSCPITVQFHSLLVFFFLLFQIFATNKSSESMKIEHIKWWTIRHSLLLLQLQLPLPLPFTYHFHCYCYCYYFCFCFKILEGKFIFSIKWWWLRSSVYALECGCELI